jgi:hypothetical protein
VVKSAACLGEEDVVRDDQLLVRLAEHFEELHAVPRDEPEHVLLRQHVHFHVEAFLALGEIRLGIEVIVGDECRQVHERDRLRRETREDAVEYRLDHRRRIVLQHEERIERIGRRQLLEVLDAAQLPELDVVRVAPDVFLREREMARRHVERDDFVEQRRKPARDPADAATELDAGAALRQSETVASERALERLHERRAGAVELVEVFLQRLLAVPVERQHRPVRLGFAVVAPALCDVAEHAVAKVGTIRARDVGRGAGEKRRRDLRDDRAADPVQELDGIEDVPAQVQQRRCTLALLGDDAGVLGLAAERDPVSPRHVLVGDARAVACPASENLHGDPRQKKMRSIRGPLRRAARTPGSATSTARRKARSAESRSS